MTLRGKLLQGLALLVLTLVGVTAAGAQEQFGIIMVPEKDPEMSAAISKGRATLSSFWQALDTPGPDEREFALKAALPTGKGGAEHIWTNNIERQGGKIFGTINNVPEALPGIRLGQRIEIPEPLISDWMYTRFGKIVGGYTIRALLPRMSPPEAARIRAMLSDR